MVIFNLCSREVKVQMNQELAWTGHIRSSITNMASFKLVMTRKWHILLLLVSGVQVKVYKTLKVNRCRVDPCI